MPYLKIPGGQLFYEDVGKGPAIVLAHGTTGNSDQWYQQVPAFVKAGYRCVRFDTRSYGRSQVDPGQENVGSIADDIEQIRAGLKLGKIFVVGQANGAEGAIDYALDYSAHCRAIVAASSFRTGDAEPAHVAMADRLVPIETRRRPRVELQLGATYRAHNPDGVKRFLAIDESNGRGLPSAAMNQQRRAPSDYARLGRMKVPTLIVAASEDILTPPALMRELADHIPKSRFVVIEGAGRYAFWEKPDVYNRVVIDFFRRHRRGAALDLGPDIPVRQGTLSLAEGALDYLDAGRSHRAVLLAGAEAEDRLCDYALAGYHCIHVAPQPGTRLKPEHIETLADALGLGSLFLVAGADDRVLADFAAHYPDRVRGFSQAQDDSHAVIDFLDGLA